VTQVPVMLSHRPVEAEPVRVRQHDAFQFVYRDGLAYLHQIRRTSELLVEDQRNATFFSRDVITLSSQRVTSIVAG